jgi:hypothetical protein
MTVDLQRRVVRSVGNNDLEISGRKRPWLIYNTETWSLKAEIVETEVTSTARQQLGKQVSAATDTQATIDELLGMFSIRSVQSGYKEEFRRDAVVEFRSSEWAVSRVLSSARKVKKMALWAQMAVGLWREYFTCAVNSLRLL